MSGSRGRTRRSATDPAAVRLACALYRRVLDATLTADARRFREPMLQTFRTLCMRRSEERSSVSVLALALGEIIDVVRDDARRAHRVPSPTPEEPGPRPAFGRNAVARLDGLVTDLRISLRILRRRPGFTLAALATLMIGIGSTTAIFTVVDHLALRPLPFPHAERLVELWSWKLAANDGVPRLSPELRRAWTEQTDLFDAVEAFNETSKVLGGDEPERIRVTALTHGLAELLAMRPVLGRPLVAADSAADAPPVVILSEGLWRRRFGADAGVIGDRVRLDETSHEVVGVMDGSFAFPDRGTDAWVALGHDAAGWTIARLPPGIELDAAQRRADELAPRFVEAGLAEQDWGIRLNSLRDGFVFSLGAGRGLWVMFGAVCLLLLIATINVTNLLLSQTASRRRELAVRSALGAGRRRVVRQLLIEAALIGGAGAVLGSMFANLAVALTVRLAPQRLDFLVARPLAVDGRVITFALVVGLGTTLAFALLPALHASRPGNATDLRDGAGHTSPRQRQRARAALVVGEVAIAAVLLVGAGLLVRSMSALLDIDPGFDTDVTVVTVNPIRARHGNAAAHRLLVGQLEELGDSLPGVTRAAVTDGAPPLFSSFSSANRAQAEGQPPPEDVYRGETVQGPSEVEFLTIINVTDDYFAALGISILEGRTFAPEDAAADVAIISEDFARRFWHGASPIGRRLRLRESEPWLTIVGVVDDVRQEGFDAADGQLDIYYPMAQARPGAPRLYLLLRGELDRNVLLPALRRGIRAIDPQLPIESVAPMADLLADDLAEPRFSMILLTAFAAAAMLLAAVGIYGVLAFTVVQRTREIGIRMALGARRADVLHRIVRGGMLLAGLGLGLGGIGAWGLTRFMRSLLFEVEPLDPASLLVAAAILAAIALAACAVPALRATRIDPVTAFNADYE